MTSLTLVATLSMGSLRLSPIPVFPRILVPLSIVYNLRKFDALTLFRSVVMALGIRPVPLLVPLLRGITRKRNMGIIKLFTESRKQEFPFTTFT